MSKRQSIQSESLLTRWMDIMTSSSSSSSSSSSKRSTKLRKNDCGNGISNAWSICKESSVNDSPIVQMSTKNANRMLDETNDRKCSAINVRKSSNAGPQHTPPVNLQATKPSSVSPVTSPFVTNSDTERKKTSPTRQRLEVIFHDVARGVHVPPTSSTVIDLTDETKLSSGYESMDSSVIYLHDCMPSSLEQQKEQEVKKQRKAQSYRRSVYQQTNEPPLRSSTKSDQDSGSIDDYSSDSSTESSVDSVVVLSNDYNNAQQIYMHRQSHIDALSLTKPCDSEINKKSSSVKLPNPYAVLNSHTSNGTDNNRALHHTTSACDPGAKSDSSVELGKSSKTLSDCKNIPRNIQNENVAREVELARVRKRAKHTRRVNIRVLARRPTWDPHTTRRSQRRKEKLEYVPQIFVINHPNPGLFFSKHATKVGARITKIRALGRRPFSKLSHNQRNKLESNGESIEHSSQIYEFDGFHETVYSPPKAVPFTLQEFKSMWTSAEEDFGESTEDMEEGSLIRKANRFLGPEESHEQANAQYGRLLPDATDYIFREVLHLSQDDIFVDIGHGIGNSVLQAAFTIGCESRGIELVEFRNSIASKFQDNLLEQLSRLCASGDHQTVKVGNVVMRRGRLEEETHRNFILGYKKTDFGCVKALANNFNGVFADRCSTSKQKYFLDNYIAGLFAGMKPGSMLVTLHPLLDLPPSLPDATELRSRHKLNCDENASFYEMEKFVIGKANECVSWSANGSNRHNITVYRYKRLNQKRNSAVFMCCNPECRNARRGIPVEATKQVMIENPNGTEVRVIINHCECNITGKGLRRQRKR